MFFYIFPHRQDILFPCTFVSDGIHILGNHEDAKSTDLTVFQRNREIRLFLFKRVKRYAPIVETQCNALFIAYDLHIEVVGIGIVNDIQHELFDHHAEFSPNVIRRGHLFILEDGGENVKRLALDRLKMQSGHGFTSSPIR